MSLGRVSLVLLILISVAVFLRRIFFIFRCIGLGHGKLPTDHSARRLIDVAIKGVGQKLVLQQPSGLFHVFIFWGFLVLTFGTIELLIAGTFPGFSFARLGWFYSLMDTSQDVLAFLVAVAIVAAVFRRAILRPVRLQGKQAHTADAFVVLGLIGVLIVAFYGMRVTEPRRGFLPVTNLLRALILGSADQASSVHVLAYHAFAWVHNVIVLVFLAYIPYSKHLHIVTALPNLYFREERVRGRIPNINLEIDDADHFGIVTIGDFSKKDLLDLTACTECGRCQQACPAYATGKTLSPKEVVLDLKAHLFEEGARLLQNADGEPAKKLYGGIVSADTLWACTTCFACETVCPVEIQPMTKLLGVRQARVLMEGDLPTEAQVALRNLETQSNPWGLPQELRADWAQGLGVKTLADEPNVEYLLFVGCAGAYDQRYVRVTRSLVQLMQRAGVSFGILGTEEYCTGDSAKRIGNEYLAQMLAKQNVDTMTGYGVKKIVTACPHCFNSIRNEFPQLGGNYEVLHHAQLLETLIRQGRLNIPATQKASVTYHDSCYLSRYNGVIDAPRHLIRAAVGTDPVELSRNRKNSFCCGAGGGRMWMEERIGTRINVDRAQEAISSGCSTVATACPYCMTMLADGVQSVGKDGVSVRDIAEILAESMGLNVESH